jgi:hypothetical protein
MTSRRSRSNQINQQTLSVLAERAKDMDTKVESPRLKEPHVRNGGWCNECGGTGVPEIAHVDYPFLFQYALKEPAKATPYLDPKHICAYDGPVRGCVCQSE